MIDKTTKDLLSDYVNRSRQILTYMGYSTFIVKKDHNPIFYNLTGLSYQVVDLIHQLIKLHKVDIYDLRRFTFIWNYKHWLERDDKLYSILSSKIMNAMKYN